MMQIIEGSCHCGDVHWRFDGDPESATACNCTVCRRYGVLWIYGQEGENVFVNGPTTCYVRGEATIEFHHCVCCGCVSHWRGRRPDAAGRRRLAVNVRLAAPGDVEHLPIDHFDGFDTFEDLPRDHRCVRDYWI